jgi:hypothetical protein
MEKMWALETMTHVNGVINVTPPTVKTISSLTKLSKEESFRIGWGSHRK